MTERSISSALAAAVVSIACMAAIAAQGPLRSTPDLAREARMADEIVDAILDGEPLQLTTPDGQSFLAIAMGSATPATKGTVVLLHGRGLHPDWVNVMHPLRVGLTDHGWNTLSVQLPVLDSEAKYNDYVEIFDAAMPRIDAAMSKARAMSTGKVVLLAHSCGSHMAQHWIRSGGDATLTRFDAFVGIGMGATDFGQPMREPFVLDRLTMPVLDLYAEHDYNAVLSMAPQRLAALRRGGNRANAQRVVADAEHYFVDRGEVLTAAVADWLDSL